MFKKIRSNTANCRGFTILEVLIAALITGVLTTAAFQFYTSMHNQTEAQFEVSEIQNLCRASVHDIKKTLRMAGFKLSGHDAFTISGDSLQVYYSETQPVDEVVYYLEEFNDYEYYRVPGRPEGMVIYKLMKRVNDESPATLTDFITGVEFTEIDSKTIEITVTAQASKSDATYADNNGYRIWSLTERVCLRNLNLTS